jgi:hypothetical protein
MRKLTPGQYAVRQGVRAARARHTPGAMNKLEARYAAEYLAVQKLAGEILGFRFEPIKLRLADKTWYAPDFLVITSAGIMELHEVKGHWEDDARVKWKVAAEFHPWYQFVAVQHKAATGWTFERVKPLTLDELTTFNPKG